MGYSEDKNLIEEPPISGALWAIPTKVFVDVCFLGFVVMNRVDYYTNWSIGLTEAVTLAFATTAMITAIAAFIHKRKVYKTVTS